MRIRAAFPLIALVVLGLSAGIEPTWAQAPPSITSFSPTSGVAGTDVVITGTGFVGTTSVTFNGVAAGFTVDSDTQITATVPSGAGTGPIVVTTPLGTAQSAEDFVFLRVRHRSRIRLALEGHLTAEGRVSVPDGTAVCRRGRTVLVQRRVSGEWRTVRRDLTRRDGTFRVGLPDRPGTYRALVKAKRLPDDLCLKAVSDRREHRHVTDGGGGGGGGGNCDPSYPTVCIPPPPPDLDCSDIPYTNFEVKPPDPHNFDSDGDGVGCEA